MSFVPKIEIIEDQSSFCVKDCSSYEPDFFKIDNIISAQLSIQPPSATSKYPVSINTFPGFPNKTGEKLEIFPAQVGENELESGEWKFKFSISFKNGAGKSATKTAYVSKVFIKSVECCIEKKIPYLNGDAYRDDKQKALIEMGLMLDGVKKQIACGATSDVIKTIDYLKAQCKCCGCH